MMNVQVGRGAETKLTDMERFDFAQVLNVVRIYGEDTPGLEVWAEPLLPLGRPDTPVGRYQGMGIVLCFRLRTEQRGTRVALDASGLEDVPGRVVLGAVKTARRVLMGVAA